MSLESEGTDNPPRSATISSSLTKKRKIRGGFRAHSTKLSTDAKVLLSQDEPDILKTEHLSLSLKEKVKTLQHIDDEIFNLISNDDVEAEVINCEELRSEIQSLIVKLDAKTEALKSKARNQASSNFSQTSPSSSGLGIASTQNTTKLPKLQLPKYEGDPRNWQEWWDAFEIIHNSTTLASVDKFRHLKTLLEGPAAKAISGIQMTNSNYEEAVDILKKRFSQKQIIINAHMEALLSLQRVSSERDIRSLRKLYDAIEVNVRSLKTLGIDFKQYGALLIPVIMNKVPDEIRLIITKGIKGEEWELDGILEILQGELEAREQSNQLQMKQSNGNFTKHAQGHHQFTTSALVAEGRKITCSYCNGSHYSAKCEIVSNPQARKAILRKQGRCFVCIRKNHLSKDCRSNVRCYDCKGRHHSSICDQHAHAGFTNPLQWQHPPGAQGSNLVKINSHDGVMPINDQGQGHSSSQSGVKFRPAASQSTNLREPQQPRSSATTMYVDSKNAVLLQTAKGYISAPSNQRQSAVARIIFDSGSQRSYISQRLRDHLSLPTIGNEIVTIKTFGNDEGQTQSYDITQFSVRSPYWDTTLFMTAYVVPVVCAPLRNQQLTFAVQAYPHLKGLPLADFQTESSVLDVDILVGLDSYWLFMTGGCIKADSGGPVALESRLGWVLSGELQNCKETSSTATNFAQTHVLFAQEQNLSDQVSKFWSLESIGIHLERENSVYQQFEEEIRFTDGRYEVKLPWKPNHPVLPDNYFLSKRRLQGLLTKLKQDRELFEEYDSIIKTQEEMGIIERVSDEECTVGRTHYLPHHAVLRQDKATTKVRVVYDASAKTYHGVSLNNCLYEGPCLLKTVAEILVRFRMYPIALTSDIEKAFLMISIHNSDRDALRFLWYEDIDKSELELVTYRFCRVVFGVSCSPFLLNATLKKHVEGYTSKHGEVCNKILNSLYADDINTGAHTVEETIELYRKAKQIMKEGGFNLRKWRSNSDKVTKEIMNDSVDVNKVMRESPLLEEEDETYAKVTTKKLSAEACEVKVLGIPWKSDTDELILKLSHLKQITGNQPITKRTILKTIASIFDPLGLISPVTTPLKVYMQGLFQQRLGWDEPLSNILQEEWISMVNQLEVVEEICLPRYYFDGIKEKAAKIQLIGFCDSSEKAYAASVYARVTVNDETSVKLVMSKSRVAPLSRLSIPRLELLSCLILARVIVAVKEMINAVVDVDIVHCYTDSISALYWIKGLNKEWKIFVENRVQEIRKLIKPELWSHCPGKENPADIPTRKSNISKLANRSEWWYGPEWLRYKDLPCFDRLKEVDVPQDCLNELRIHSSPETSTLISTVDDVPNIQEIITMDRFSDYGRILRVAAYVVRFIENCRNKDSRKSNELTAAEISKAERIFIVQAQSSFEGPYLDKLEKQLGVFKDKDGLLRCKGRLNNSSLDIETRNPILIPRNHILANLIVKQSHENVLHNGVKETLMDLRSRFWIVKGRQLVKKIVHACKLCTRIQGLSYGHPEISQLPEFRVKEDLAFTSVGIDFAGPLFIKTESQALKKVYIALITCATTRALHLEIVPNLSCEAFLLCLKRFVSRRGVPNLIVTDNAKTFKAASKRLTNIFKSAAVNHYLVRHNIKWKYNLAKAPWWGGFYERLIKGVKLCLKKNVGKSRLSYDELQTIVSEIEGVLNSRPLTYLYSNELEEPLTPSQLVIGKRLLNMPEYTSEEEDFSNETPNDARKREQYLSKVMAHYWRRWKREYLVDLREYQRMQWRTRHRPEISKGDVVTIENENNRNRLLWKLGKVEELIKGRDNVIRGARVRLANGNFIDRPLQKLFPLELHRGADENETEDSQQVPSQEKPRRKAAELARERIELIDQLEEESDAGTT